MYEVVVNCKFYGIKVYEPRLRAFAATTDDSDFMYNA